MPIAEGEKRYVIDSHVATAWSFITVKEVRGDVDWSVLIGGRTDEGVAKAETGLATFRVLFLYVKCTRPASEHTHKHTHTHIFIHT